MENTNLNNKGFTLIELLAVIVILAIVMVLASTSIIPFMQNASKDSFAIEANGAMDAASNAISLISIGSIERDAATNKDFSYTPGSGATGEKYCFSIDWLVDKGLFDLDTKSLKSNGGKYAGVVEVSKSGNAYSYTVSMYNGSFKVSSVTNTVERENVSGADNVTGVKVSCN